MNMLDLQMGGAFKEAPISSKSEEQASHAAAPKSYGFKQNAMTITLTIGFFYVFIYLLHAAERVIRK